MQKHSWFVLLLGLLTVSTVLAQDVWVPLDLDGDYSVIDKRMARKIGLWPQYDDLYEAQLLQHPDSNYTLVIRYYSLASRNQLLQNKKAISHQEVEELRRVVSNWSKHRKASRTKRHKKEIYRKPITDGNHRLVARIYGPDNKRHFQGLIMGLEDTAITIRHRPLRDSADYTIEGMFEQEENRLTIPVSGITWVYIRRKGAVARGVLMGTAFAMTTAAVSAAPSGDGLALTAWVFIAAPTGFIIGGPYGKRWSRFRIYGDSIRWKSMMESVSIGYE